jgi:hypothetical protein
MPLALIAPIRENPMRCSGVRLRYTPPASAASTAPERRWLTASCTATSALAHAASIV